ncbi:lipocalin [Cereibacter sphaeroides]|uniref:lipocalin family protein n=1 Tax=Cereibacter sphaeroides TaxID=1063 RepID=UPI000F53338C|nr:lipocalin family protein [Cereibacter sphaeroides]AZB54672.1 lipocalin [Cereibacter sphaeroides]AZB58896.1 lipocalin [Cereibacter sphaeroides]
MKAVALLALLALVACERHVPSQRWLGAPLFLDPAVQPVDLAGRWYEVASYPAPFQKGCTGTTADYQPLPDGRIALTNRCRVGGTLREISGTAEVVAPGKLTVNLQGVPFGGDYWILGQSRDGRTLVVGTPTRIAGWVLHRDPKIAPEELRAARDLFERSGYDAAALERTRP